MKQYLLLLSWLYFSNHQLNFSEEEIKFYIGILPLTGYALLKNIRMFWELKKDTHNELVSSAMRRNRFFEIHKYLHTSDNTKLFDDKFAKVSLHFSYLNGSFKII